MDTTIICDQCKGTFGLAEIDLKEEDILVDDGAELRLTSYTCPMCNKRYTVLIDSKDTLRLLADYRSVCKRLAKYYSKHKTPPSKLIERMFKAKQRLTDTRNRLNKRYDRSFYQIGDKKEQLELCVPATKIAGEKES